MKKILNFIMVGIILLFIIASVGCKKVEKDEEWEALKERLSMQEYCHDSTGWRDGKARLYCEEAGSDGVCCESIYPYHDGHGTCWSSLSGCRQTGWTCTRCW
jgi:hypothetical protein